MFIRKKKYPSGNIGLLVCEKVRGKLVELHRIGVVSSGEEIDSLVHQGKEWIYREQQRRYPTLDLFGKERQACEEEVSMTEKVLSNISNMLINGSDLILDRVFGLMSPISDEFWVTR